MTIIFTLILISYYNYNSVWSQYVVIHMKLSLYSHVVSLLGCPDVYLGVLHTIAPYKLSLKLFM